MTDQPKFCRDCRFMRVPAGMPVKLGECGHPALRPTDAKDYLVSGEAMDLSRVFASVMRMESRSGGCGPKAKLFESREETT